MAISNGQYWYATAFFFSSSQNLRTYFELVQYQVQYKHRYVLVLGTCTRTYLYRYVKVLVQPLCFSGSAGPEIVNISLISRPFLKLHPLFFFYHYHTSAME